MNWSNHVTKGYRSALRAVVCLIAVAAVAPAAASASSVQVGSAKWFWGNPLPQGNTLRDVAFVPGTTIGYAVGDFGTILKTADAGLDWTGLPAGTFTSLKRVQIGSDGSIIAGAGCVRISTNQASRSTASRSRRPRRRARTGSSRSRTSIV